MARIVTRKNIINSTLKINDMSVDQKQELLLMLLDSNPTIVIRALDIDDAPPLSVTPTTALWKVAITDRNNSACKINIIKAFRVVTGSGLGEAKSWSEGQTIMDRPSGVFGHSLNREEANELLRRVKQDLGSSTGIVVDVIRNEAFVRPLPYDWSSRT